MLICPQPFNKKILKTTWTPGVLLSEIYKTIPITQILSFYTRFNGLDKTILPEHPSTDRNLLFYAGKIWDGLTVNVSVLCRFTGWNRVKPIFEIKD